MSATNDQTATIQAINNDYEYIQYNQHLRLIHSIKDDMYQMQSIITVCKSTKNAFHWFEIGSEIKHHKKSLMKLILCLGGEIPL